MTEGIYLDNNATTKTDPLVYNAMIPFFTEFYGNPSSMHSYAEPVRHAIDKARHQVAEFLGAEYDDEIIFTACATESDNTALWSAVNANPDRPEIITTAVEHPAILDTCRALEKKGYKVHYLGVDEHGRLDLEEYRRLLSTKVAIVSVMWANNETGTIFPVEQMAEMAKEVGAQFHTDGVQAAGKINIDLKSTKIDMLSFSGHKIHAPKGIGVLYVRRGTRFRSFMHGGHQERGRRAGTENAPYIVGLGVACELAQMHLPMMNDTVRELRDRLQYGILKAVPNCFVTGDVENRTANTLNIAFEYVEGESILLKLNEFGIAATSGSACTSGSLEPSHVMKAMKIPFTSAHGTVRFSLSRFTKESEIDKVIEVVPQIISELRSYSPYWQQNKPKMGSFDPDYKGTL
ncbi:MAG: cysteine desulfurase NifS [Ruminobacter sp.]|nr:cysteine desulfurase NifS [Ruminobacter sp.]